MIGTISTELAGLPLEWWLALLPALAIGIMACAARLTEGGWLAPGAAWAGFWACAIWLPILLAPKYPLSPEAIWVLVSIAAAVYLGAHLGQAGHHAGHKVGRRASSFGLMRPLSWIGTVSGFLMTGLTLVQYQSSWSIWLSPSKLGEVANAISVARYAGEANESVLVRFCLVFCYLGSLAGGHAMAWRERQDSIWWSFGPIAGALSYAVLTTAKAGLLIAVLLWLAAFATEAARRRGHALWTSWKTVILGALSIFLVVILFVSAMLLRYGFEQGDDREFLLERLRNYSLSHLTAFSSWWDSPMRAEESLGWGQQSLFGPAALVGLSERQQGVYDVIQSERYFIDSNLFTLHRSLIADFSYPGALVLMAAVGYIAGRSYRRILTSYRSAGAAVILTAFYSTLGWSHIVNMFGYTTLLLAFFLYALTVCGLGRINWNRTSASRIDSILQP